MTLWTMWLNAVLFKCFGGVNDDVNIITGCLPCGLLQRILSKKPNISTYSEKTLSILLSIQTFQSGHITHTCMLTPSFNAQNMIEGPVLCDVNQL